MRRVTSGLVRNRVLAWAFAAAFWVVLPAHAGEEPVKTVFEWFTLPRTIGSLDYMGEHSFEEQQPGLGRGWQYERVGLTLTIYVYDEGEPGIPDGIESERVTSAYEASKYEVLNARREGKIELLNEGTINIGEENALPAREAVFDLTYERHRGKSYLWLTAVHGQFVKVRFTAFGPGLEEEQLSRGEILQALSAAISRDSAPAIAADAPLPDTASEPSDSPKRDYSILISDETPAKEMPFWIAYAAARATIRDKLGIVSGPTGVSLKPEFEEQVAAFTLALVVLDEAGRLKVGRRSVVADIQRVANAGYLREYIWTYLREDFWQQPADLRLPEFDAWRAKHLKKHKAVLYSSIALSEPEAAPSE